jgi:hypothetical protein
MFKGLKEFSDSWTQSKNAFRRSYTGKLYIALFAPVVFVVFVGLLFMDSFKHNMALIEKRLSPNELSVTVSNGIDVNNILITWNPEFCSSIPIYKNGIVLEDQFKENGINVLKVLSKGNLIGLFSYSNSSSVKGYQYKFSIYKESGELNARLFINEQEIEDIASH